MADLLSLRGYARHRGVTLQAVQKAIQSGRIGTVKDSKGKPKIDPETADRLWNQNTSEAMQRDPKTADAGTSYANARAIRENYLARLAKLDYEAKAGKLLDADKIKTEWTAIISTAKSKILSVPSKAKAALPHLTLNDISTIEELIREALEEIAACKPTE